MAAGGEAPPRLAGGAGHRRRAGRATGVGQAHPCAVCIERGREMERKSVRGEREI